MGLDQRRSPPSGASLPSECGDALVAADEQTVDPRSYARAIMQFHLNGFRPGDPRAAERGVRQDSTELGEMPVRDVDVLIVGCGPAGLTLAAQLAAFPTIKTEIVDMKSERLSVGQADGIACRTMEMFEAFGFSDRVMAEGYWVNETTFWKPDPRHPEHIVRTGRVQDTEDGLSEFPHMILNQARVHDFFLDVMANSPTALEPTYSRRFVGLDIDPPDAGSGQGEQSWVTATLERVDLESAGQLETVRARYVVGCDGARSAVRKAIGRNLVGDSANQAWGVMDVLAVTDFPDIRFKSLVRSTSEGSLIVIPREGGYMVRLYVELEHLDVDERVSNRKITAEHIISAARRIISPYALEVKEVVWWSVYEIGQRLCDRFDNVSDHDAADRDGSGQSPGPQESASVAPKVFIAGDACHTHSPKAGQGMNVSMRDSFNLGWKLASVIGGRCSPELLHTYSAERQAVARELIDFDREWAEIVSGRPEQSAPAGSGVSEETAEFQRYFIKSGRYTAGTGIQYGPSLVTAEPTHQQLAKGFPSGCASTQHRSYGSAMPSRCSWDTR